MPIKDELYNFIKENVCEEDSDNCNLNSELLEYLENVFTQFDMEEFDFDDICEMLEAYIPIIATIKRDVQINWLISMIETQRESSESSLELFEDKSLHLAEEGACAISTDHQKCEPCSSPVIPDTEHDFAPLMDMFPSDNPSRLRRCYEDAGGCMDRAIDSVLAGKYEDMNVKQELGKELSPSDESSIKDGIVNRYSLYEAGEEAKHHRPVLPKYEKVKQVRYLNNQVVDTKGSKYLEIKPDNPGPKPIHLKPLKKYRFH